MAADDREEINSESAPLLAELGNTGLRRSHNVLTEEWHPHLSGPRATKIYREMADNDPVIGGALLAIETLIRRVEWGLEPADESEQAAEYAGFIDDCRKDMEQTWSEFISEALSALTYGWSFFEVVYKIRRGHHPDIPHLSSRHDDGKIGWRKLAPRSQDSLWEWDFDKAGNLCGMWQSAPPDYKQVFIPLNRALLFRIRASKDNPEGRSLLRNAYTSYFFAKRIREIEAIGVERDLAGLPVMQLPVEIMQPGSRHANLRADWEDKIVKVRRGQYEGLVLPAETDRSGNPTGFKFSLVQSGGRRPVDVNEIIKRHESRILISLLSEFLVLGMDKVGSFSLSSDKTDLFTMAIEAILESIEETFNRRAIPDLCRLNGISEALWPRLNHSDIEKEDVQILTQNLATASTFGGLSWSDADEDWFREKLSAPPRDPNAETLRPAGEDTDMLDSIMGAIQPEQTEGPAQPKLPGIE